MSPVVREDGSGSNTYNIEAISSSDSDSDIDATSQPASGALNSNEMESDQEIPADLNDNAEYVFSNSSSSSTRSSSDDNSLQEDESSLLPDPDELFP